MQYDVLRIIFLFLLSVHAYFIISFVYSTLHQVDNLSNMSSTKEKAIYSYNNDIIAVSRVHMKSALSMPNPSNVIEFVLRAKMYSSHVLVCIGAESHLDAEKYIENLDRLLLSTPHITKDDVTFLPISPWGYITRSLNVGIQFAQDRNFKYILFQVFFLNFTSPYCT